ncbi:MAG TPA: aldehyde dehydrogenase [Gammaproteobacteria bacterium]|nr:aldehyde dehydrogenase [Gammaproteobacteria bacterium]HAO87427.1 aldehyde dehydrogenase [Gammaproteobacteria bacterium]HCA36537.1 aldehyde dehydrogenase [Gammaproteobacteria bacterium]|tara:strand:+ start:148 stop:1551 length:1404 start_codon:yes stop_codon:yes gene_type:complete
MNQPGNPTHLQCISPVDGSVYVERELADPVTITQSIELSRSAQKQWQQTSIDERARICEAAVQYFEEKQTQIAEEIAWQMGRPIAFAGGEVNGLAERARHMIASAEQSLADIVPAKQEGFNRFIRRQPLGTVFTIAPWNYPLLTAVNSIVPALMAGNSVILKPSAQVPLCGEHFTQAFEATGIPEGVIQNLFLSHADTEKIIGSRELDFVCFTGSVPAGQRIEQAAAGTFVGVSLELGGKDPAYVREDADFDSSVESLVDGTFFNSGQSCCGIERIYVHETLFDKFVEAYVEQVKQYVLASPLEKQTTLGPVVKNSAADWVRKQVAAAIDAGATPCIDPSHFPNATDDTTYLAPQVLIDVNHKMSVMSEESFGPVVGIMPVSNDEEAVGLMNDSDLGLTASLWTQNESLTEQLGERLQCGTVFMNRCDYLDPALVWTGVKNTGRGAALSELGYHQLTQTKSFHLKNA